MTGMLRVRTSAFSESARLLGDEVAIIVGLAASELVVDLEPCAGMAGSDDVGVSWGRSYDEAAAHAMSATARLLGAANRLAALLQQSGINYAGAEAASTPGDPAADALNRYADAPTRAFGPVSASIGAGMSEPSGWSLLAAAVGTLWPNGHQDLLHAAATAWRVAAQRVYSVLDDYTTALLHLVGENAPESGDAVTLVGALRDQNAELGRIYHAVADGCDDYAAHLDAAHSAVLDQIKSFLEWTVAIESAGAGFTLLTLGVSELAAQAGEAIEISRVGAAIARIIETLKALASAVAARIAALEPRLVAVDSAVEPMSARGIYVARMREADRMDGIPVGKPLPVQTSTDVELAGLGGTRIGAAMNDLEKAEVTAARRDIGHAEERHQFPSVSKRKSQFFEGVDMDRLADTSGQVGFKQKNGCFEYIMHSPHDIGVDRTSGLPTNIYTVVRNSRGRVVTMYPGQR